MTFGFIALVALLPVAVAGVSLLVIFGDAKRENPGSSPHPSLGKKSRQLLIKAPASCEKSFLLKQGHLPAFKFEQSFLQREASAKPRQAAVIPDHAMARNDNRNRIRPICGAHSSYRLGSANSLGHHLIGNCFAIRNILKRCPDLFLKLGSFQHKRQIKRLSLTSKIGSQLVDNVSEHGAVLVPIGVCAFGPRARGEAHQLQSRLRTGEKQLAKGTLKP